MENDVGYTMTIEDLLAALITQIHFNTHDIDMSIHTSKKDNHYHLYIPGDQLSYAKEVMDEWQKNDNLQLQRAYVWVLLEKRNHYKKIKEYEKADLIRKALNENGADVLDTPIGYKLKML